MAIYHHSVSVVKRSSGKSAVAGAAYRAGEKIEDKRTGLTHDYTKKTGVDHSEIITPHLPTVDTNWLLDRAQLWNRVEAFEKRHDSQLAREINIAIPTELDRNEQIALVREYVRSNYIDRGMVADVNFHDLQSNNPHVHIMLTMRDLIVANGRVEFGNKNRDWNSKNLLLEQRQSWETLANKYLAAAGYDLRIDCRSLAEQEIDRIPQIHLGKNVTALRAKGIPSERGDRYDQIDLANAQIRVQLEEVYNIENEISNLEAQAAAIKTEQKKFTTPTRPQVPELLQRLPYLTGERTCTIGRYQTKQFTNPSVYQDGKLVASYTRVGEGWTVKVEADPTGFSLAAMETTLYEAGKLKHITAHLTRDFQQKFRRADLTDPKVKSLLDEVITQVNQNTPDYNLEVIQLDDRRMESYLRQEIDKHQEQQRAAQRQAEEKAAQERYQQYIQSLCTEQPAPRQGEKIAKPEPEQISLKQRFANITKQLIDLTKPKPAPQPQQPKPTTNQPTQQPDRQPTRPDLAQLAVSLLEKIDSQTIGFDNYGIELINGKSSRPTIKISQYNQPLIQINGRFGEPWTSELKNPIRTLNNVEKLLEYQLKIYNIKMDLAKDYKERVIDEIGNVSRDVYDNDHVKSTVRNLIDKGMKNIDLSTYDSECIITFDDNSIELLTATIEEQIEVERVKAIQLERAKLVNSKTINDIVPTAGELRAAYFYKSSVKNTESVEQILEVGRRLNQVCPEHLKVNNKAPDDFKDESVFIQIKYLKPTLADLNNEPGSKATINPEYKAQKKSRSQDNGLSM